MDKSRIWVLGALDPEMVLIDRVLRECGETVVYAADARGERVTPATAYRADRLFSPSGEPYQFTGVRCGQSPIVYAVECDGPALRRCANCGDLPDPNHQGLGITDAGVWGGVGACGDMHAFLNVVTIDHHRPGDPGYGRPPEEFLPASSIGQVISELARLGRLPMGPCVSAYEWVGRWEECQRAAFRWFHWEAEARTAFSGGTLFERFQTPYRLAPCDGYYIFARRVSGVVEFAASEDEMRDAGAVRVASDKIVRVHIPHDLVLAAAADHCLAAAYRGECPGVDPDDLMRWRVETRASHQSRSVDDILADVEAAREVLQEAPLVALLVCKYHGATEFESECGSCASSVVHDLRGRDVPELPEAAAREGVAYLATVTERDGRRKVVLGGHTTPEVVHAFMTEWAPAHGLMGVYGDPARGFAGAYMPEVE